MVRTELYISSGSILEKPAVTEGTVWTTQRAGAPAKLTFSVIRDKALSLAEGDAVMFSVNGRDVFKGYIFSQSEDKNGTVSVTAYDSLRYFRNRETTAYAGKTASRLLSMLCADLGLETGIIEDTKYVIPSRVEDDRSLFDIMGSALDLTLINTGELFVLFDDFGKISLRSLSGMTVSENGSCLLLDAHSAENFSVSSSIDSNTYDRVQLTREDKKTGKREVFTARDDTNARRWGVLRYTGKVSADENGRSKAESLLRLYNAPTKTLKLTRALGDARVRGGSVVAVLLDAGGSRVDRFMLVESARHTFGEGGHFMDITLRGGEFNG